jgi:hypothetical protein
MQKVAERIEKKDEEKQKVQLSYLSIYLLEANNTKGKNCLRPLPFESDG